MTTQRTGENNQGEAGIHPSFHSFFSTYPVQGCGWGLGRLGAIGKLYPGQVTLVKTKHNTAQIPTVEHSGGVGNNVGLFYSHRT